MSDSKVLVVGSVAYDDVETPHGRRENLLGGSATYFSVAASRFAAPRLVGVVGSDFEPADRAMLAEHGVDLDGLEVDESGGTFRWGGRYHENMNDRDTLFTHLNVFTRFEPKIPAAYTTSEFAFLGNIDPELQLGVLDQLDSPRFVGLDTMNFWIEGKRDALEKVLSRIDGLFVNDEEGALLTDRGTALTIGRALQSMGPSTVVLKRGEHGALLFHGEEIFHVPAYPLENVVDPTGAGDTFAGGFFGYLTRCGSMDDDSLRRAMICGSIMASFCVEGFGLDRLRGVTLKDIEKRYAKFTALTRCPDLTL
ncbi:MAG: sugar/nucleoside kinase (ribokinase family) [Myxococcota bacterium]|jgi:sugar/nucleoside kinase (ribokinase family)